MAAAEPTDHAPEITAVRDAHRFDEERLSAYLRRELDGFSGELRVRQFEGGQSNPTFLISDGGHEWVLRKKPPGKLLRSAHQVEREHRLMDALRDTDVPVPRMSLLCEDDAVLGTPFFVMEFVPGRISQDPALPGFSPAERTALYESFVDVMAALHRVDPMAVGLEDLKRPGTYYERQVSRWTKQYEAAKTVEVPAMEELIRWLPENMPTEDETRIVHGDFRPGNCVLHPTEPRVVALLDWELCALGHPLADLAYFCQAFHLPEGSEGSFAGASRPEGVPDESTLIARYREKAGRGAIENWTFYVVFGLFRSASIAQGVYKRGLDGNASSTRAMDLGGKVRGLAEIGWRLVTAG